jgi:hypothetical protein
MAVAEEKPGYRQTRLSIALLKRNQRRGSALLIQRFDRMGLTLDEMDRGEAWTWPTLGAAVKMGVEIT